MGCGGAQTEHSRTAAGGIAVRALIVDDSKAMRSIVGRIVKEIGFEILEAANGREGLAQLEAHGDVELILIDWNMPVMNGIEFLQAVRAQHDSSAYKMLMVTTASDLAHINTAIEAGANEYLMKPFTKDAMVSKLQMLGILEA
jgi:two-component system chemotaxis response regulator CheY